MIVKKTELLCIGNAMVDIFAAGKQGESYGLNRHTQHIEMEKLYRIIAGLENYSAGSGGGAANVAKIAALMGANVSFTGATGSGGTTEGDRFEGIFKKDMLDAGVKLSLRPKPAPTGICLMLQAGDKTRIAASPSAALKLSKSDINEVDIKHSKLVVIDGFMLDRKELVGRILSIAEKHKIPAALDLASPSIAEEHAIMVADYAKRQPLILFMNKKEALVFHETVVSRSQGEPGGTEKKSGFKKACSYFASLTEGKAFPIIVVTLADRGAVYFTAGKSFHEKTRPENSKETTGAGDAFRAAFLTAWARELSLSECASLGNKAARIILDSKGTQLNKRARVGLARLMLTR